MPVGASPMTPEHELALGIALMLLAGVASVVPGYWLLGIGLLCVGIAMAAVTVATRGRRPRRPPGRRR